MISKYSNRNKQQEELIEANAKLKAMIENTDDYIMIADEKGIPIMFNSNYKNILKIILNVNIKPGQKIHELINDEKQNKFWDGLNKKALSGKKFIQEFQYPINGKIRHFVFSFHPVKKNNKIIGFVEHSKDVTEWKETQQAIKESEMRFKNIFNQSPIGIGYYDKQGRCIEMNKAAMEMFGIKDNKYIHGFKFLNDPNISTKLLNKLKKGNTISYVSEIDFEQVKKYNLYLTSKQGRIYINVIISPLYDNNKILIGYICQVQDISDQIIAEKIIEESEKRFRSMIEHSADIITLIDRYGKVLYESPSLAKITGYKPEDRMGKSGFETVYHEDLPKIKKVLKNVLDHPGIAQMAQFRAIKKDGTIWWVEGTATNLLFEPSVKAIVINYRDISDRKNTEEALQKQNERYIALNKELINSLERIKKINSELKAAKKKAEVSDRLKTAFLANMSHEIRTPMNGIIGFSEMFLNSDTTDEKRKYYANIVIERGQQLLTILDDILYISKIETGNIKIEYEEVVVNNLIMELFTFFNLKKQDVSVKLIPHKGLDDSESTIFTSKTRLNQIITNMLNNAFKFTSQGEIKFGYEKIKDELRFYVKDTGIGIPTDMHEKIFEPFRQVETEITRHRGGTGLGLSICKTLVELIGGKIWVESEVNKGATFYFTIPYNPVYKNKIERNQPIIKKSGKYNVLVAEDDQINLLYVEEVLSQLDINFISTGNGIDAVKICKNNPEIDLVIMDIKMPLLDGYEATKQIKLIRPDLPIIAYTAFAQTSDREKALEAGCIDYISKPAKSEDLLDIVKKHLQISK